MAVFKPTQAVCELNFNDRYIYALPLHEDTADKIDRAVSKMERLAPKDKQGIDEAYNAALDIIDEIVGEGSAEDIMSIFENPGTLEVWQVIYYILDEWKNAYNAELARIKGGVAQPARAERRGRR